MGSTSLTPQMITSRTMAVLSEKAKFVGSINRDYEDQFAKAPKIGDELDIRMPIDPQVVDGAEMPDDIPEYIDRKQKIRIDTRKHVPMEFDMQDLTLDIDSFTERFIEPAASKLAAKIEQDLIRRATIATANYVGTPGTPFNSLATALAARTKMTQNLAPNERRGILLNAGQSASMVDALKGLYNDTKRVGNQYEDGVMSRAGGFSWRESESIHTHLNGTVTAATLGGAVANGADLVALAGVTPATGTIKAGTVFTLPGVLAIHPETKAVRKDLQQFTVLEDVTAAGGTASVRIWPAINWDATKQWQNVAAAPAANAPLTFVAGASPGIETALAYVREAFSVAFVDLEMPDGVDFKSRISHDGIRLRLLRDYNIKSDKIATRLDVMYGFKAVRPEWACRIAG